MSSTMPQAGPGSISGRARLLLLSHHPFDVTLTADLRALRSAANCSPVRPRHPIGGRRLAGGSGRGRALVFRQPEIPRGPAQFARGGGARAARLSARGVRVGRGRPDARAGRRGQPSLAFAKLVERFTPPPVVDVPGIASDGGARPRRAPGRGRVHPALRGDRGRRGDRRRRVHRRARLHRRGQHGRRGQPDLSARHDPRAHAASAGESSSTAARSSAATGSASS